MATTTRCELTHALPTVRDYRQAVAEIDSLLDGGSAKGTREFDRLELLSVLVAAYEDEHDPVDESGTPQEVVDFMLEQHGMARGDLASLPGGRSRVSEFFGKKRPLSITQIKRLRDALGIPADLLID
jgi:HTH-type transcriptional regulator / antitoxin HigA